MSRLPFATSQRVCPRWVCVERAAVRSLAGALALCAVLSQAASFAHLAVVRHAVCPEHGEWIHSDARASQSVAAAHDESASATLQPSEASAFEHEHTHCGIVAHRRDSLVVRAAVVETVRAPASPALRAAAYATRLGGRAVVDYAPKASPPR
jgi:hypothetical protein